MPIYSIARRTTNVTSGQSSHAILTAAGERAAVLEAGVFLAAATASTYGLGRPAAAGVTATSPVVFLTENIGDVSVTSSVLAWTTSPTNPTDFHRRFGFPATIGVGIIFTFPRGILIAVSSNYVLQNLATNGVVDSYFVIDE
jgi:hypothetical protein